MMATTNGLFASEPPFHLEPERRCCDTDLGQIVAGNRHHVHAVLLVEELRDQPGLPVGVHLGTETPIVRSTDPCRPVVLVLDLGIVNLAVESVGDSTDWREIEAVDSRIHLDLEPVIVIFERDPFERNLVAVGQAVRAGAPGNDIILPLVGVIDIFDDLCMHLGHLLYELR
mgnify:CR=1 FL=1